MVFHGKWYDEVNVGESFGTQRNELAVECEGKILVASKAG